MGDTTSGVEVLLAPNPSPMTGPGTNTYLVSGTEGPCIVIDPGPLIEEHLARITQVAATHGGAQAILITHGHPDHVEGAARLQTLTGAPILAWSREGTPDADRTLSDVEVIPVGDRALRVLHTPGHRFDHLCFLLEGRGDLFAGDLVAGVGTVVIAPPEGDLLDYMASLRRLRGLDLHRILPAHGPAIDDPRALLDYYIAHRQQREEQVLAALGEGPRSVDALVANIYADVDPAVRPMAALSLTAHLQKLEREGRVSSYSPADASEDIWELRG